MGIWLHLGVGKSKLWKETGRKQVELQRMKGSQSSPYSQASVPALEERPWSWGQREGVDEQAGRQMRQDSMEEFGFNPRTLGQ